MQEKEKEKEKKETCKGVKYQYQEKCVLCLYCLLLLQFFIMFDEM